MTSNNLGFTSEIWKSVFNINHSVKNTENVEKIWKKYGEKFSSPLPHTYLNKDHTNKNIDILYLKVTIKFRFFRISNPLPPISAESQTSLMMLIEVAPYCIYF